VRGEQPAVENKREQQQQQPQQQNKSQEQKKNARKRDAGALEHVRLEEELLAEPQPVGQRARARGGVGGNPRDGLGPWSVQIERPHAGARHLRPGHVDEPQVAQLPQAVGQRADEVCLMCLSGDVIRCLLW
jgi:hypothetical protein